MFSGWIIFYFIIGAFVSNILAQFLGKRTMHRASNVLFVFSLIAGIYCLAAGIFLAAEWQDPFANANISSSTYVRGRGRGGLVILVIKYWPYVLIGLGGFIIYHIPFVYRISWKRKSS
ncbi:MAG: hypothetical protein HOG49_13040 [Candidatus Scalindua sp.]|jgi:hypothetical protein|nr:hypothetical protein [Candidatus Scalindua sp.]